MRALQILTGASFNPVVIKFRTARGELGRVDTACVDAGGVDSADALLGLSIGPLIAT